jgi:putative transposase
MPYRKPFLGTGEFYHIFNRSIGEIPVFIEKRKAGHFLQAAIFYLNPNPPTRFSIYRKSPNQYKIDLSDPLVEIITYCLMPTHFHFSLRQVKEEGIKIYFQRLGNSFVHYFNLNEGRRGPLFESPYSSYRVYLGEEKSDLVSPEAVISCFSSPKKYEEFVLAQKDYQRELEKIKHLLLEG